jgi:hypothetical protein
LARDALVQAAGWQAYAEISPTRTSPRFGISLQRLSSALITVLPNSGDAQLKNQAHIHVRMLHARGSTPLIWQFTCLRYSARHAVPPENI